MRFAQSFNKSALELDWMGGRGVAGRHRGLARYLYFISNFEAVFVIEYSLRQMTLSQTDGILSSIALATIVTFLRQPNNDWTKKIRFC